MDKNKRLRLIEKLTRLADPARNPNVEERKAAQERLDALEVEAYALQVVSRIQERQAQEPLELKVLFTRELRPKPWEEGLFGYICKINGCEALISHRDNAYLLRCVGKASDAKKAELQFSWAHDKVKRAGMELRAAVPEALRDQYEHGAARELVKIMQETCETKSNLEAVAWVDTHLGVGPAKAEPYTAINPYFSEGGRALKKTF